MSSSSIVAGDGATKRIVGSKAVEGATNGRVDRAARRRGQAPRVEQTRASGEVVRRVLDARPDTADFRDLLFVPTLIEVPPIIELDDYLRYEVPVLDQGVEGACTGFGLATVANYLLRRRMVRPDTVCVSPRMFYEIAKRYDEWPGEEYDGSSARGAMKGWHKHGVCADEIWIYDAEHPDRELTEVRSQDALRRPLGAYFRVNHKDLVAMHAALAEVRVLYATAKVHAGWQEVGEDGEIRYSPDLLGGHAFAIVAFDEIGFWIQNSWGTDWGRGGYARISYDDWLANATDVWVARLGAPVVIQTAAAAAATNAAVAPQSSGLAFHDLRPHIISIGNDGRLRNSGTYATTPADVETIVTRSFPATAANWQQKRLLLYAHGGLVAEANAVQRVADYRAALLPEEVYPLSFIWKTDLWTTVSNILDDAFATRRPEGILDAARDFVLDRADDFLEPVARALGGKLVWDEMKENARRATSLAQGGARLTLEAVKKLLAEDDSVEIHVVAHSAGAIFHAPLVKALVDDGVRIATCTLWAPACTIELFKETYLPAIESGGIERFALFTLSDKVERDDHVANVYHKSILYLVANAFEEDPRIPLFADGEPLLGLETFVKEDDDLVALFKSDVAEWIVAPTGEGVGAQRRSDARAHGAFDDDEATVRATLARILAKRRLETDVAFHRSAASMRDQREAMVAS
jgi:hypothetical protein